MNPRAKFGGGKVSKIKKYSGTEGSDVEADDVEAKRTARAKRIREYNATPRAQEAKRTAEEMVRKLNIPGPDEPKSSSAVDAIKAGASRAAGPGKGTEQGALTAEQRKRLDRPTTPTSLPPSKDKPKESLADKNSKTLSQMLKKHVKEHPEPYPTKAEADILREQEYKKMDKQTNEGYENYKKRRQSGEMSEYKKGGSVKSRVDGCAQRGKTRGSYR
jgi:hypothetical protein